MTNLIAGFLKWVYIKNKLMNKVNILHCDSVSVLFKFIKEKADSIVVDKFRTGCMVATNQIASIL